MNYNKKINKSQAMYRRSYAYIRNTVIGFFLGVIVAIMVCTFTTNANAKSESYVCDKPQRHNGLHITITNNIIYLNDVFEFEFKKSNKHLGNKNTFEWYYLERNGNLYMYLSGIKFYTFNIFSYTLIEYSNTDINNYNCKIIR